MLTDHSALPLRFSVRLIRAMYLVLGAIYAGMGVTMLVGSVYAVAGRGERQPLGTVLGPWCA